MKKNERFEKLNKIMKMIDNSKSGFICENVVCFDGNDFDEDDYEMLNDLLDEVGYKVISFEDEKCVLKINKR